MSNISSRISIHCDDDENEFVYINESPKRSAFSNSAVNLNAIAHHTTNNNNNDIHISAEQQQDRLRQQKEEEESIELARQLMAEEAMASYEQHFHLMRQSADQLSPEDYDALQRALGENEFEVDGQDDPDGSLSYDAMLDLGDRIGDVKTERWAMIANTEVNKIPTFRYSHSSMMMGNNSAVNMDDSEHKCLVCQFEYEENEELRRLPCGHCFHTSCVDVWLQGKDVCPYCRQCIIATNNNE